MKKLSLLLTIAGLMAYNSSMAQSYTFTKSTGTYTDITGGTSFLQGSKFTDTISTAFNIKIAGITGNKLYVSVLGTISASGSLVNNDRFETFSTEQNMGDYTYTVSGSAGSRIMKLQFKNVKFPHDFTSSDYMNYQVWLYEADMSVEMHFGSSAVNHPDEAYYPMLGGPAIGSKGCWLKGAATSPVADTTGGVRITGTPANGTIYKFTPTGTGIDEVHNAAVAVYPVPAHNELNIDIDMQYAGPFSIAIYDMQGRMVKQWNEPGSRRYTKTISVKALQAGNYILKLSGAEMHASKQFTIE